MSWTALVAEYLVIGLQCSIWIMLVVLRWAGISVPEVFTRLYAAAANLSALILLVVLAMSYFLGMLFDKLFHRVTEPLLQNRVRSLWKRFYRPNTSEDIGTLFYRAEDYLTGSGGREARLYRRRGRVRILRAGMFNVPLIGIGLLLHVSVGAALWWAVLTFTLALATATAIAFAAVHEEYVRMIARVARSIAEARDTSPPAI